MIIIQYYCIWNQPVSRFYLKANFNSAFPILPQIFTEDIPEVESLPRAGVLDYLTTKAKELAIPYLEHIIHNCYDTTPDFHNRLIHLYREKVQEQLAEYIPSLPEGKF